MNVTDAPPIQMLLDSPRSEGMILSCYADTRVVEGFDSQWKPLFQVEAQRLRRLIRDNAGLLQAFDHDVEALHNVLSACHSPGIAVFCASDRGYLVALPSAEPYCNRLVVDEEPYLVPLLIGAAQRQEFLVIVTNTHHGQLYAAAAGIPELLFEVDEDVPKKQHSAGERWGKHQATIVRHREDHILHFFKELADRAEEVWDGRRFQGILLLGEHVILEHFRRLLPKRMASRVIHEGTISSEGTTGAIRDAVQAVFSETTGAQSQRLTNEISQRLKEGFAVATGPQEVLEALKDGQVATLVLGPDPGTIAYRCAGCRSDFVVSEENCPYCGSPCEKTNCWQEILLLALRHNVHVCAVDENGQIPNSAQVAALLARDEPQWA